MSAGRSGEISYELAGSGDPIVFIQGVGVHGSGWKPQTDALSACYSCLTFDNRGIGNSVAGGKEITIPRMAEDALALMDAQGWNSANIVGHSMGGLIALQSALTAPARVRTLSLLCTFARSDATRLTPRMLWIGLRTRIGPRAMRRRAFLELVAPPGGIEGDADALAERLGTIFGHDLADSPPVAMKQLSAMSRCDLTPRLGELAGIRTLVVSAEHDLIAPPASGRAIAEGIPGARYVEIAGAAHGVPIVRAERINALLAEHVSGLRT